MEVAFDFARAGVVWPIAAQAALVIGGVLALVLTPPADGTILLVPLTPAAARALPALALDGDTRLIARGALPGSLVVRGRRAALGRRLLPHAILPLASSYVGCAAPTPAGEAA